jgi:hypothetical protein
MAAAGLLRVGAGGRGGIGYYLAARLRVYEWGEASLLIVLILVAVISSTSSRAGCAAVSSAAPERRRAWLPSPGPAAYLGPCTRR